MSYPYWKKKGGKRPYIKRERVNKLIYFQDVGNNQIVVTFGKGFYNPSLINSITSKYNGARIDRPEYGKPHSGKLTYF